MSLDCICSYSTVDALHEASHVCAEASKTILFYTVITTAALAALGALALAQGALVSVLTGGQYTTISAAILTGPFIYPVALTALKIAAGITIASGVVFLISLAINTATDRILYH